MNIRVLGGLDEFPPDQLKDSTTNSQQDFGQALSESKLIERKDFVGDANLGGAGSRR